MNVATDPWIPVITKNGTATRVSLSEIFRDGSDICDLALRVDEHIAVMRLLICIAQVALRGPEDWVGWRDSLSILPAATQEYLKQWEHAFTLYDDDQPFLQLNNIEAATPGAKMAEMAKLDVTLATGGNSAFFDLSAGTDRTFSPESQALMLITHQCFSPCGTMGIVSWNGRKTGRYVTAAPCSSGSMLHTYILKETIIETIHSNLITQEQANATGLEWGKPVWECHPVQPTNANILKTYLGRLVPLSRCIRLMDDNRSMLLGDGLKATREVREVAATYLTNKEGQKVPLPVSLKKATWRELQAIVVAENDATSSALCFANIDREKPVDIWVGGLLMDRARPVEMIESVFHVPAEMFRTRGHNLYADGVKYSEQVAKRLGAAVSVFGEETGNASLSALRTNAYASYWTTVEQELRHLLALPGAESEADCANHWGTTRWGHACRKAAKMAYDDICPHATTRQMEGYVKGLAVLNRVNS